MKMKQEKIKQKNVEMAFINVVLYPSERQKPEEYIKVLSSIMGNRVLVRIPRSDKLTLLRTFELTGDYYHGYFCSAIFLGEDSKVLNVKENALEKAIFDPNKGLEAKDMEFWFFPEFHRFAIFKSNVSKIVRFLSSAFEEILGDKESFAVNVENDSNSIDRIINSKGVVKVNVSVRYTNNDNCEEWEALDLDLRESDTTTANLTLTASKTRPIQVIKNRILKAFLRLSKSYGSAKAMIMNQKGIVEEVNTKEHPQTVLVDVNQSPAEFLRRYIEKQVKI